MTVAELIHLLEACDPDAVVLIPRDADLDASSEIVADVVALPASAFATGRTAVHGAVRLGGITTATMIIASGPRERQ